MNIILGITVWTLGGISVCRFVKSDLVSVPIIIALSFLSNFIVFFC